MSPTSVRTKGLGEPLDTAQRSVPQLLRNLALARGCSTIEQVKEFLNPQPALHNPLLELADLEKALERTVRAIRSGEAITIFGDYDCDGVTSTAQFVNLLRASGHTNWRCYIPDRFIEDYGLTIPAVEACLNTQKPALIIAVDCGSSAIEALEFLRAKSVDVIVLDHHQVHHAGPHPSFAHLNPKGDPRIESSALLQDAARMSAAGLCYFFCSLVADRAQLAWDKDANLVLGGLGTYVDVMPLVGTNRALVKHSVRLANGATLRKIPGLLALVEQTGWYGRPITEFTFGFVLGPCLNATGRLTHAKASLNLLCAQTTERAVERAKELVEANAERKSIQDGILSEAIQQAETVVKADPDTKVLVLYGSKWHTGVVGIVAGRIRERFNRPTIVMARLDNGYWKGSGRSVPSFDIGSFVTAAVREKVLTSGGGHAAACGVKLTDEQIAGFVMWTKDRSSQITADFSPEFEVAGDLDWLAPEEWAQFFHAGAPWGQGNPRPAIVAPSVEIAWGPEPRKRRDQTVWCLQAGLRTGTADPVVVTCDNLDLARHLLAPEQKLYLLLEFSRTVGQDGRRFDNWRVAHGEIV